MQSLILKASNLTSTSSVHILRRPSVISEEKWNEIQETEERDLFICSIREEIISNAFEQYAKTNISERSVKFLVECAHEAWKKIIRLYFFNHDRTENTESPYWKSDVEPTHCEPDSYAVNNVKLATKVEPKIEPIPVVSSDSIFESIKGTEEQSQISATPTAYTDKSTKSGTESEVKNPSVVSKTQSDKIHEECLLDLEFLEDRSGVTSTSVTIKDTGSNVTDRSEVSTSSFSYLKSRKSTFQDLRRSRRLKKTALSSMESLHMGKMVAKGRIPVEACQTTSTLPPIKDSARSFNATLNSLLHQERRSTRKSTKSVMLKNKSEFSWSRL